MYGTSTFHVLAVIKSGRSQLYACARMKAQKYY